MAEVFKWIFLGLVAAVLITVLWFILWSPYVLAFLFVVALGFGFNRLINGPSRQRDDGSETPGPPAPTI
ncbi:MAG TPA: hypothetical protein VKA30_00530 [Actinomycetota bacterium]|nr:hypothetical protein [Actinomycetota bacterium]